MQANKLRVILLKPSKYGIHGFVERFQRGFMPNAALPHLRSMTPSLLDGVPIETEAIDEYVQTDLDYLKLLHATDHPTLLALVGVQSHQLQRSLDLAAYAMANGVRLCVMGGPHPMTCDTSMLYGTGVSFALSEAETVWTRILRDAIQGELEPVYGNDRRWQQVLESPVVQPPSKRDLNRYVFPMLGLYPARGCPFTCSFCSVIKIAGRRVRSQDVETTMASLRAAKAAGVRYIMFTSDNFNKYPDAPELLERMIEERIDLPFFIQCDVQIARQEDFVELLGRAGCLVAFVGVESFNRKTLLSAHKAQNHPEMYGEIVRLCRERGILTQFSNIIGFPDDTLTSVREHVDVLRGLDPDCAQFYILTPIPGTQQYDEFLAADWITEKNLDRFDITALTWRHPHFDAVELQELLFECYRRFFTPRHFASRVFNTFRPKRTSRIVPALGSCLYHRYFAAKRMHPMSGGVGRIQLDHVNDYAELRRNRFGYDLLPLPSSLKLSDADAALNRLGVASV